jgi:hypothetical protein
MCFLFPKSDARNQGPDGGGDPAALRPPEAVEALPQPQHLLHPLRYALVPLGVPGALVELGSDRWGPGPHGPLKSYGDDIIITHMVML